MGDRVDSFLRQMSKICDVRELHPEEVTFGDYANIVVEYLAEATGINRSLTGSCTRTHQRDVLRGHSNVAGLKRGCHQIRELIGGAGKDRTTHRRDSGRVFARHTTVCPGR
jgi:hypothetical protein